MGRKPSRNLNLPAGMRARHRGERTYYFFDTGERPRREISLGTDLVLATQRWAELAMAARPSPGAIATFVTVRDRYIREVLPTKAPATAAGNIKELEHLSAFFGDPPAPLDDILPIHVRQYLDLRGQSAKVRANREKALLSHMWNKAREWGYTDRPNPCAGVRGFREQGRSVYVEAEVYDALYKAASEPVRDAMDLAYLTGQRPSDVLGWSETNIRDGMLVFTQGKTGKKMRMAIEGELAATLVRIADRKRVEASKPGSKVAKKVRRLALVVSEHGEPLTLGALEQRWTGVRAAAAKAHPELAAEILKVQFRDLRAKAGTDKADDSGDIRQAQGQLGHSSVVMTEAYVRARRGAVVKPTR